MRTLLYLIALLLLMPQLLIVATIKTVAHLTTRGTLGGLFTASWNLLDLLLGWGGLAAIAIAIALFVAGSIPLPRFIASLALLLTAAYTSFVLVMFMESSSIADAIFFLTPGAVAIAAFVWLIRKEWPRVQSLVSASGRP